MRKEGRNVAPVVPLIAVAWPRFRAGSTFIVPKMSFSFCESSWKYLRLPPLIVNIETYRPCFEPRSLCTSGQNLRYRQASGCEWI